MESLLADVRYAFRLLTRAPAFTLAVVLVLALGIGSNSAIFTVLDKTVIRPLPYANPDRLAMLWEDFSALGNPRSRVSLATFLDWRKRTQSFEASLRDWLPEDHLVYFVSDVVDQLDLSAIHARYGEEWRGQPDSSRWCIA